MRLGQRRVPKSLLESGPTGTANASTDHPPLPLEREGESLHPDARALSVDEALLAGPFGLPPEVHVCHHGVACREELAEVAALKLGRRPAAGDLCRAVHPDDLPWVEDEYERVEALENAHSLLGQAPSR